MPTISKSMAWSNCFHAAAPDDGFDNAFQCIDRVPRPEGKSFSREFEYFGSYGVRQITEEDEHLRQIRSIGGGWCLRDAVRLFVLLPYGFVDDSSGPEEMVGAGCGQCEQRNCMCDRAADGAARIRSGKPVLHRGICGQHPVVGEDGDQFVVLVLRFPGYREDAQAGVHVTQTCARSKGPSVVVDGPEVLNVNEAGGCPA